MSQIEGAGENPRHKHEFGTIVKSEYSDDGWIIHDYFKCDTCTVVRVDESRIPEGEDGRPDNMGPLKLLHHEYTELSKIGLVG